jgi:hypothetical protein
VINYQNNITKKILIALLIFFICTCIPLYQSKKTKNFDELISEFKVDKNVLAIIYFAKCKMIRDELLNVGIFDTILNAREITE